MQFAKLCEYFEKIEQTTKRLEKTELLREIIVEAERGEIKQAIYLALGELRPKYDKLEFNLAEKMVVRAIANVSNTKVEEILKIYKEVGDLGEVVGAVTQKHSDTVTRSVGEVYEELSKIAQDSGQGSQERKVTRLAKLLKSVSGNEAKYIIRMVLSKLRLGFADKTILDSLSYIAGGDKSAREQIENLYQMAPDVGELASLVKEGGVKGAKAKIEIKLGRPIMPALAQRLPTASEMIEKMGKVIVEPKFDGTRCITGSAAVFERKRGYLTVRELKVGDEILSHKGNYCRVSALKSRERIKGERVFELKSFMGDQLRISEGHPILVFRDNELMWKKVENLSNEWLFYPKLKLGNHKSVPNKINFEDKAGYHKTVNLNERTMQLLGFWVGDGISNTSHQMERVGIVCNKKQVERIEYYEKVIREEFKINDIHHDIRHGADVLYWRDPVMRRWLCENFRGENDSGKRIPDWFLGLDEKRWLAFLLGWRQADGTDTNGDGYRIVTKERKLVAMGHTMCLLHGKLVGVRRIRNSSQNGGKKTYYELIIPGTNRYYKKYKNGFLVKMLHKRELKRNLNHRIRLYDIQVDKDESFCISLACLHNCQIHYKKQGFEKISSAGLFNTEVVKRVKTFTRNLDENSQMFPELLTIDKQIMANEVILDSEAVGYDPKTGKMLPFQMTITRKRKHGVEEASSEVPLKFFVFDILYLDGENLLNKPLWERREILTKVIKGNDPLLIDEALVTEEPNALRKFHTEKLGEGLEGVVVKQFERKYLPGRQGFNWVKFKEEEGQRGKLLDTLDVIVMGYYRGKGKRTGFGIGAFLVGIRGKEGEILTIAKIGTGLTDEQFRELKKMLTGLESTKMPDEYRVDKSLWCDVWVIPKLVVEVAADELSVSPSHSSHYALRFPRLVKLRPDKDIEGVTAESELSEFLV